jgi:hypothetical protein
MLFAVVLKGVILDGCHLAGGLAVNTAIMEVLT